MLNNFKIICLIVLFGRILSKTVSLDKTFKLTNENPSTEYDAGYLQEERTNEYLINLNEKDALIKNHIFIILESENPEFYINVWHSKKRQNVNGARKVGTYSGNAMFVLGQGLHNGKLQTVKETGKIYFSVKALSMPQNDSQAKYKLKIQMTKNVELAFGKSYTTMMDSSVSILNTKMSYDGTANQNLQKLRFQLNAIRTKPNWQIDCTLSHKKDVFMMNPVFKKTVGGVLSKGDDLPVCSDSNCEYNLKITSLNVHMMNIETFFVENIEKISINHYEDYYDRVYKEDSLTVYELPFIPQMENLDISISLIPVTAATDLFVNINTLPNDLEAYDFKEQGPLSKRLTIPWKEIQMMKAEKSSLFIAVRSSKPGEFLLKIDAHEEGLKGTLTPGVIEYGKALFNEIANYLYTFEVIQTQDISFDVILNVNSGNADLFLKQCSDDQACVIESQEIEANKENLLSIRDSTHKKDIGHTFTCKHAANSGSSSTICQFAVAVLGKENLASHFELSLRESEFHRLSLPGQTLSLNLNKGESTHIKFSLPKRHSETSQLFLSYETHYGDYDMFLSKNEKFPNKDLNELTQNFKIGTHNIYDVSKDIELEEKKLYDKRLEGIYYLTMTANKDSSFDFRFYEKSENQISIHTLTAGKQVNGQLNNSDEIMYYSIHLSLDNYQSSSVVINLTSLKGQFILLANKNGILPTLDHKEFISENGILELKIGEKEKMSDEFLIGVALHKDQNVEKLEGQFQYMLSLSYIDKPVQLKSGILVKHNIQDANMFVIEIKDTFNDLLILKSVIDGYNIQVCGHFTTTEPNENQQSAVATCEFSIKDSHVSLYLNQNTLKTKCEQVLSVKQSSIAKCYLVLNVTGFTNQGYRIGFTYNDHPFQLVKGMITDGPFLANVNSKLHFVYHAEAEKSIGLYFNSKGRRMNLFTRLVRSNEFDDSMVVNFPTQAKHDESNMKRFGFVQNAYYSEYEVKQYGNHPELLISVLPDEATTNKNDDLMFDGSTHFILQTAMETIEMMRTQTLSKTIFEGEWNYFSFYNNGNTSNLKVYAMTNIASPLEMVISRGLTSKPPITNKPLKSVKGIGSAEMEITIQDLRTNSHQMPKDLRDHFVVGVKSTESTSLSIYWNNKEDLNFVEVTPSEPSHMLLTPKKSFYFSVYARDANDNSDADTPNKNRKDVKMFFKLKERANIYVLKSISGELEVPSASNFNWKSAVGDKGGIAMISIPSNDPNYCVECKYIGFIETDDENEVTFLVDIEHNDTPKRLKQGFTFPEYLDGHSSSKFRLFTLEKDTVNFTISMLTGFVNVFIGTDQNISPQNYKELYSLEMDMNNHKYIPIIPSKYGIKSGSELFVFIENPKKVEAAFTLTIDKNNEKSPIEPGITKFINIKPSQSKDFYYQPSSDESEFEVKLELTQVMELRFKEQALALLESFVSLYVLEGNSTDHEMKIKPSSTSNHKNIYHMRFTISKNTKQKFGIRITNKIAGSELSFKVELFSGGYKLINMNEPNLGVVKGDNVLIYEVYGNKNKYVFANVKKCIGNPKLSFYEKDYSNLEIDEPIKFKKIKDENSYIQYAKLSDRRAFIKVENDKTKLSIFRLNFFNERDMDTNPYSDIKQDGDGKVEVDTSTLTLKMKPLRIMQAHSKSFITEINYIVYLSPDVKVMRYAKNCDTYMIKSAFEEPDLKTFKTRIYIDHEKIKVNSKKKYSKIDEFLRNGFVNIKVSDLEKNKKYYGVVVAKVSLYPADDGRMISSLRDTNVYYDEFSVITPRLYVPVKLIISCFVILAFLAAAFQIIKSYIFDGLSKFEKLQKGYLKENEIETGKFSGPKAFTMLERAYYEEKRRIEETRKENDERQRKINLKKSQENSKEDHCQEIEMQDTDDKMKPLELDA